MKPFPATHTAIDQFPVAWSKILPSTLGKCTFAIRPTPNRFAPSEWLGIVSSHDRKNGFARQEWQDSLHSALQLAHKQGWGILVAREAPYAEVVLHACKRLQVPFLVLEVAAPHANVKPQGNFAESPVDPERDALDRGVLELAGECAKIEASIPVHDSAMVFLCNRLFVVALRSNGKIAKLLAKRLSLEEIPSGTTYLSFTIKPKSNGAFGSSVEWLDRGAVGWLSTKPPQAVIPLAEQLAVQDRCRTSDALPACPFYQPTFPVRLMRATESNFLVHCTRARRGPWPDQSLPQFHDELMQHPWDEQPTPLMTLERILKQQRLIATNHFRRADQETVCFAAKELSQLLSMRRFQSHLARWDWEPYGIMIDRDWLQNHGAKKVKYIDREEAKKTSPGEFTYCQIVSSQEGAMNWRQEQEWRIAGDVRLNPIPFSKAVVFVSSLAEANALQPISRWPIAICS